MYIAHRWIDRNLTRLELIMALTLIAVFIGYFLRETENLFDAAEQRLIDGTVANIQTALSLQSAIYQARGDTASVLAMEGMNPFEVMSASPTDMNAFVGTALEGVRARQYAISAPANYAGVIDFSSGDETLEPGKWYFDISRRELVYSPRSSGSEVNPWGRAPLLRFTVRVEFDDRDGNNVYNPGTDGTPLVRLVRLGARAGAPGGAESTQLNTERGEP